MEDERGIGNILFYVIAAIIAIVSSLKGKKKQPQGEVPEKRGYTGDFPDDLFDDEEEEVIREIVQKGKEVPSEIYNDDIAGQSEDHEEERNAYTLEPADEGVSAMDYIETEKRFEELVNQTSTYDYNARVVDEDDEIDQDIFDMLEDFDGRKAIIMSEIIARKEY